MRPILLTLVLLFAAAPLTAGDTKAEVEKKLGRFVDFDFAETPFEDAVRFMSDLSGVTMNFDPALKDYGPPPVTLRVQEMSMLTALNWLCRFTKTSFELRDSGLYFTASQDGLEARERERVRAREREQFAQRRQIEMERTQQNLTLRVRMANGTEISSSNLNPNSVLAEEILEQFVDSAADGLLTFRLPRQMKDLTVDDLKAAVKKVAPAAQCTFNEKIGLLLVGDNDKPALRRVAAVMRELGIRRNAGESLAPERVYFIDAGQLEKFIVPVPPPAEEKKR